MDDSAPVAGMTPAAAHEAAAEIPSNPSHNATFEQIVELRFPRRTWLRGAVGSLLASSFLREPVEEAWAEEGGPSELAATPDTSEIAAPRFSFTELRHGVDEQHHVVGGYQVQVLLRWGDPVLAGAPEFDPYHQTADAQEMQFGYNNDYVGFLALDANHPNHGLLLVNHEYTNEELMFPGVGPYDADFTKLTRELVEIEMAAHGASIVEVRRDGTTGTWEVVPNSKYARRLTARSTRMTFGGPAAGHPRLRTAEDPEGRQVIGTINNCAGGKTPWGTFLSGEENFHGYFWGHLPEGHDETTNGRRYGLPATRYAWGKYLPRFDLNQEPHEPNRFGWVVEVDPFDPTSPPVKRTALGRFKHEGAETIVNRDGRVVVYMGDDERFEYVYRFVTRDAYNPADRAANRHLLDAGTLSVARFEPDGHVHWLPLVHGTGPLSADHGFHSQADVVIEARRAADLLGATKMDRPEDIEPNAVTDRVYVMLTNNAKRTSAQLDAVHDRPENHWGLIVELIPPDGDHAADVFTWKLLVKAGNPRDPHTEAMWNPTTGEHGWFACPDNCAIDAEGRLWVSTDQGENWAHASGTADGLWSLETDGPRRGEAKLFFRCPVGAEMCGPQFTDDGETLFLAVQHPGADGTEFWEPFGQRSTFEHPATRWPDFDPRLPPRPSVVVITKPGGGRIGSA
jgi:uncharacterized protein